MGVVDQWLVGLECDLILIGVIDHVLVGLECHLILMGVVNQRLVGLVCDIHSQLQIGVRGCSEDTFEQNIKCDSSPDQKKGVSDSVRFAQVHECDR